MKKIVINIFILTVLLTGFVSCKKYVEGYDKSPNSPSEVTNQLLLSNVEVAYFATVNGQLSRQCGMMVQQFTGIDFQARDINGYSIEEGTNTNEWNVIYSNGLVNAKKLYTQAGSANPYYQGMSKVLESLLIGVATDLWGDVPNREAGLGIDGKSLNPAYDAQSVVIADIQKNLDEAIILFGKAEADNVMLPGGDDFIYGGDATMWLAAAHALKARYHNRLSKKNAAQSATDAINALTDAYAAGFSSSASDMNASFGSNSNEYNQWYAFTRVERRGYIKASKFMTDLMNGWSDPRRAAFFLKDTGGVYNGSVIDEPNTQASEVGNYLATANGAFPIVTYVEAKFIEAEAKLRSNDNIGAATAYNDAVKASVLKVTGSADATFEATYASETALSINLTKIMEQKYVASYGQIEAYNDWRRTNLPALTPNPSGAKTAIPRRLPTTIDERLYNSKAPSKTDILEPVWWDAP